METPPRVYEEFQERFQLLLSEPRRDSQLAGSFSRLLTASLAMYEAWVQRLEATANAFQKTEKAAELWDTYDYKDFQELPSLNSLRVRQVLSTLPGGDDLIVLLEKSEKIRVELLSVQKDLEGVILSRLRRDHPRFSSVGIIESDVQSDALKDYPKLARR